MKLEKTRYSRFEKLVHKKRKKFLKKKEIRLLKYNHLSIVHNIFNKTASKYKYRFITFNEPKYMALNNMLATYRYNLLELGIFVQMELSYDLYSNYIIQYTHNDPRYHELFHFPSDQFQFSWLFQNIYNENIFIYQSIIKKIIKTSQTKQSFISDEILNKAVLLQYINMDVYYDIYSILTPEGRAVNKYLSRQSALQMFSYFNLSFIKYNKHCGFNFNFFYGVRFFDKNFNKKKFEIFYKKLISFGLLLLFFCLLVLWYIV